MIWNSVKFISVNLLFVLCSITQAAEWTENLSHKAEGITKLIVFAGPGNLTVTAKPGVSSVKADLKISYPGSSSSAKKHLSENMDRYLKRDGKKLTLKAGYLKGVKSNNKKAHIDLAISMPEKMFLDLRDTSGDIKITGLAKGGRILDGAGSVNIENSKGSLTLIDGSGHVKIFNTTGKLKINDLNDDIEIHNHRGELVINDKKGNLVADEIKGRVRISDSSGHIKLKDIKGKVKITNTSGDIQLASVYGNVELKDGRGDIQIKGIKGNLNVKSDKSGKVDIDGITGSIKGIK